ncbi:MAG: metallophosphoesterase [Clostridia bacterium]|nr:metallophosphoesterase [Clostridia bacterium]
MRIGVISDTHGVRERAKAAVERMGPVDLLLHAGDHFDDAIFLSNFFAFPIIGVRGNCDFAGPAEELVDADGIKILLTHGHQYGVKRALQSLAYRAEESEAKVVVFGHTHEPEIEWAHDILLFNPGSTARPRGVSNHPTFGIINIAAGIIKPYIGQLE